jgi:hypothetical protein
MSEALVGDAVGRHALSVGQPTGPHSLLDAAALSAAAMDELLAAGDVLGRAH